ncbi:MULTISPECIES: hypothetical protein [Rhodopirellula]|uniref:hypothetical protein n=1 Tax=Rhodopirellula TaxID=265488 RepID=UPI00257CC1FE|nr:hypothetical protein [Rhodopirellula sp. UBA1907]|tara:strand:+ start:428 stop:1075 length:648 start_codon:yes stop_codon:yes gene_type:complete
MTNTAPHDIDPDELRLLGHFYQNDFPLDLTIGPDAVCIDPPKSTWKSMVAMTTVIGLLFTGFVWVAIATDAGAKFGPLIWVLLLMIGLLAIAGPVVGHQLRLRYLRERSPLVAYSSGDFTVSILGGQKTFGRDEVYALMGVTLRDSQGESKSELQLITRDGDSFVPHLITTDLSGSASQSYGKILRSFRETTQIRTMVVEPEGLLNRGPMRLAEL